MLQTLALTEDLYIRRSQSTLALRAALLLAQPHRGCIRRRSITRTVETTSPFWGVIACFNCEAPP